MNCTFLASRSCEALLSIRKDHPGHVITGPGISYRLLARNQKKATHYRIEIPDADLLERWVPVECGRGHWRRCAIHARGAGHRSAASAGRCRRAEARGHEAGEPLMMCWRSAGSPRSASPKKPECRWQTSQRPDANYLSLHGLWPQPSSLAYCNVPAPVRMAG